MARRDVSVEAMTFEGGLENFSADVERAGEKLLQCLRNPKIRVIHVKGYEGVGRWRIVEYAAQKLNGSDLFEFQIMVKLPERDWSPGNVQREIVHRFGMTEGVECEDDDDKNDGKRDLEMEVSLKIYESLIGRRFLLILGDAAHNIDLDAMGVPSGRKVLSYDSKVVYISSNRQLTSEEAVEYEDLSIDVLREEAVAVASSPTSSACFTPHVVLDCFFYLLLYLRNCEVGLLTRYWIAEGIIVIRDRIEEEEDLIILEKKVDALLIELKARSMVEQADDEVDDGVRVPQRLAEKAKDMVMSSNRIASTHGKFWIHKYSLPTQNNGEWEDIQRMAIWNLQLTDDLPLTLKFPKLSTLMLQGRGYTTLPNNFVFEQMQGLQVLILSVLEIRFLPLSLSSLHNFRFLSIYCCRLVEPESLLFSLQALDKLEFLQFEHTHLESIPDECLQHKNNLRSLYLSHTGTRSLPSSFPQLHNLQQLSITCSLSLTEIPDAFFERLPRLRQLILTGCSSLKIKLLPHLRNFSKLEVLDLGSCNSIEDIEEVSSSLGAVLANLRKLALSSIKVIKQIILKSCGNLESLCLYNLERLDVLYISGTQLQHLPQGISTASHLRRLDMLHMNHIRSCNSIEDIEEVSFSLGAVLPNLQKLDLSRIKVIKQIILKGCRSLESLNLSDLTRLDVLYISGTQLQQLPEGIRTAYHLRRLDMLHTNHIRKINWDDLPTELEELNFDDRGTFNSPKDDENPSDEGGARMRISNYKLLQSLKPSSKVLREKCFSRFHIRISPCPGGREKGSRLLGRKSVYKEIDLKTLTCNSPHPSGHFERHLEIEGGKRCPNGIHGVLGRTELLTLCDNAYVRKLSDLGDADEMKELREYLVMRCERIEIFIGEKNQCFERLEKIWMSDLANLRSVCDGMGTIISFPLLKHIRLDHCPRLVNFSSSGVSLPCLEKLEIGFCNRLESVFQGDVVAMDDSLQRLHTVHLWELPKLERICSCRYFPTLKKLTVRGCGKLKELPLRASPNNAIRGGGGVQVGGEMAWWENLRWEDESIKHDIHFREWCPVKRH